MFKHFINLLVHYLAIKNIAYPKVPKIIFIIKKTRGNPILDQYFLYTQMERKKIAAILSMGEKMACGLNGIKTEK